MARQSLRIRTGTGGSTLQRRFKEKSATQLGKSLPTHEVQEKESGPARVLLQHQAKTLTVADDPWNLGVGGGMGRDGCRCL